MTWRGALGLLVGLLFATAVLVFGPACGRLARKRNRDSETWFLLGAFLGPIALAWIWMLPPRPRHNDAELSASRRRRTPLARIPRGRPLVAARCYLCGELALGEHRCRPELVEDRIQGRWTVRVGGQRIIGPL